MEILISQITFTDTEAEFGVAEANSHSQALHQVYHNVI